MIAFSSAVLTLALGSLAAAPASSDPASSRREGGHTFILSEFVPSPFATTEFAMLTGVGYATADIGGRGYSLLSLAQTTRLQHPAGRAAFRGLGRRGEAQQLRLQHPQRHPGQRPRRPRRRLDAPGEDGGLDRAPGRSGGARPRADARGLRPRRLRARQLDARGGAAAVGNAIRGGVAASVDFLPSTGVPVGLLGTYDLQRNTGDAAATVHRAGAGLFYTGRSSVSIGAEGQVEIHPEAQGFSMTIYGAYFGMRHYW